MDWLRKLVELQLPVLDLGFLHPTLAGADAVQLALIALVSYAGGLFMTNGQG